MDWFGTLLLERVVNLPISERIAATSHARGQLGGIGDLLEISDIILILHVGFEPFV